MGTGPSSLGGTLSREKLLKGTAVTRQIVDIIFDFLLKNVRLRDFYSLSSPDRCRRYVLFTANQLYTKFIQFQIEPNKGKDGTILFRSVSELVDPPKAEMGSDPSKDERLQKQKLCLQLAYFYVRIIQIYGALALTLVDDSNFMVEHGYTKSFFTGMSIEPPGKLPYYASAPSKFYPLGPQKRTSGGGLYDIDKYRTIPISEIPRLELFKCFYSILYVSKIDTYSSREKIYIIKFIREESEKDKSQGPGTTLTVFPSERRGDHKIQKGIITLQTGQSNKVILFVTAEARGDIGSEEETIRITFDKNVELHAGQKKSIEYGMLDEFQLQYTFFYDRVHKIDGINFPEWEGRIQHGEKRPFAYIMRGFIEKVYKKVKIDIKPTLLEDFDKKPEAKEFSNSSIWTEDRDTHEHLKIKPLIDGMTRKRRFGHCVGRALQLLTTIPSLSGMRDPSSKATSSICDLKFSKDYIDTPTGVSLSDTASISSLANLFYDTIKDGPVLEMSSGAVSEYIQFIKQMSVLFTDKEMAQANIERAPDKALDAIKVKESSVCDKTQRPILVENAFAMKFVYPYVQELFRQQLVHASNCARVFVQLFDIRKEGDRYKVRIHPNVLSRGIDELNRLSKITRNLLIKYYSDCETAYLAGVQNIENGIKDPSSGVKFTNIQQTNRRSEENENTIRLPYEKRNREKEKELIRERFGEDIEAQKRRRGFYDGDYARGRDLYEMDPRGYFDRFRGYGGRLTMTRKRKSK